MSRFNKNKLKPCPFCNGTVRLAEGGNDGYHFWYFISHHGRENGCRVFMESGLCSVDFPKSAEEEKMKLIKSWNSREIERMSIIIPKKKPTKEELKNYMELLKETSNQNKEKETKDEKLHTVHND